MSLVTAVSVPAPRRLQHSGEQALYFAWAAQQGCTGLRESHGYPGDVTNWLCPTLGALLWRAGPVARLDRTVELVLAVCVYQPDKLVQK